ncbi:MAG: oligoribonuclease [Legionellales bacterium]|nr:oligoribonuclease [Legionellales bacterium]OUX64726.1 MAG: oligoribonuclease [Gammaproteobacteria bacterium TMED281]|tara:strand:- start:239 stop:790 length:552 start_codon:yes stop_codon:yes gene_type:complete
MNETNFIWCDLEMTGLDPDIHYPVEIATLITNSRFEIIAEGPDLIIHQPSNVLKKSSPVAKTMHETSGLWDKITSSSISIEEAEIKTLEFLRKHASPGISPMCGNTISQDRRFLIKYMPKLAEFFHYRHLDVTSLKIVYETLEKDKNITFSKKNTHRAMDDIKESVAELNFYLKHMIKQDEIL